MTECTNCDGSGWYVIEDCDCNDPDPCFTNCDDCNPEGSWM